MELTQTLIILFLLVIDIVLIVKPFAGLLNILLGFFTIIFTVITIPDLPFSGNFNNYFVVFIVFLSLMTMIRGIGAYKR